MPNPKSRTTFVAAIALALSLAWITGSTLVDAQPVIQLSNGTSFSDLREPVVSPDGTWVAYVQDVLTDGELALWIVPSHGGTPRQLTPPTATNVQEIRFSSDSNHIVFLAQGTGELQLSSNSVLGTPSTAVPLSLGDEVGDFYGPNGPNNRLVYVELAGGMYRRYAVPIEGPASARIELPIAADTDDGRTRLSPDGNWVLFTRTTTPLSSLSLTSGSATPVLLEPPTGYDRFEFFKDSSKILLRDANADLFSIPIGGPASSALNLTDGLNASNEQLSPDGNWAVFAGFPNVYSVPTNGSSLDIEILESGLGASGGSIGPNSSQVFFVPPTTGGVPAALYAAPIDGSAGPMPGRVSGSVSGTGEGVLEWEASGEAEYVVLQESRLGAGLSAGYRVPLSDLLSGGELIWTLLISVGSWQIHPEGTAVLLQGTLAASADVDQRLWVATLQGTPSLEQEILNESDLPNGFLLDQAFYGPTGDIYFTTSSSDQEELFVIPFSIFADGFESGDITSWG